MRCSKAILVVAVLLPVAVTAQTTYYVDGNCGNDSWSGLTPDCVGPDGAKATIQAGINGALIGDTIIVAPYTYFENIDFWGKEVVVRSTNPDDPATVAGTVIDGSGATVVEFFGTEGPGAVLDGLTITNGYPGVDGNSCQATISNCAITDNSGYYGAGLRGCDGAITGCTISGNSAYDGGGLRSCDGPITDCTISGNSASSYGGGGLRYCDGPITGCTISGNSTGRDGGGLCNCDGPITNCTIAGNSANYASGYYGGGLYDCDGPITNCTITDNYPEGVYASRSSSAPTQYLVNCVVWRNAIWQLRLFGTGTYDISYSSVRGGLTGIYVHPDSTLIWGDGNGAADPLFVDPDGPDDDPDTWEDNDYHLQATSPCINAGDPNGDYTDQTDVDGEPRVLYARVDMGSDEVYPIAGDFEPDGDVDLDDYAVLAAAMNGPGQAPGNPQADLDDDGDADIDDFAIFAASYTGTLP